MSDEGEPRPRPAYGEYATPEEQRARIHDSDVAASLSAGHAPQTGARPVPPPGMPADGRPVLPIAGGPAPRAAPNSADRIVTLVLLAFGAYSVVSSVTSSLRLGEVLQQAMKVLGVPGDFTNLESARIWGPIAAVAVAVIFLVTAVFAVRRLRAGRVAWWVPVVGAVIAYVVVTGLMAVPLLSDPAFTEFLRSRS